MKFPSENSDFDPSVHVNTPLESISSKQGIIANQRNALMFKVARNNEQDLDQIVSGLNTVGTSESLMAYEKGLYQLAEKYPDDPEAFKNAVNQYTSKALVSPSYDKQDYKLRRIEYAVSAEVMPGITKRGFEKQLALQQKAAFDGINNNLDNIKFLHTNAPFPGAADDEAGGALKAQDVRAHAENSILNRTINISSLINAKYPTLSGFLFSESQKDYLNQIVIDQIGAAVLGVDFRNTPGIVDKIAILNKIKYGTGDIAMFKTVNQPGGTYKTSEMSIGARRSLFEELKNNLRDNLNDQITKVAPQKYINDILTHGISSSPATPLQKEILEYYFNDCFQNQVATMFAQTGAPRGITTPDDPGCYTVLMDTFNAFVKSTKYVPKALMGFSEAVKKYENTPLFVAYIKQLREWIADDDRYNEKQKSWGEDEKFIENLGGLFWSSDAIRKGCPPRSVLEEYQATDDIPIQTLEWREEIFESVWNDKDKRGNYIKAADAGFTCFSRHMEAFNRYEDVAPEEYKKRLKEITKFYFCKTNDFTSSIQAADFYLSHFDGWGLIVSESAMSAPIISRYTPNVFYGSGSEIKTKTNNYCNEFFEKNQNENSAKPLGYYLIADKQTYDEIAKGSKHPSYLVMASYPLKDERFTPGDKVQVRIGVDVLGNKNVERYEQQYLRNQNETRKMYDIVNGLNFDD